MELVVGPMVETTCMHASLFITGTKRILSTERKMEFAFVSDETESTSCSVLNRFFEPLEPFFTTLWLVLVHIGTKRPKNYDFLRFKSKHMIFAIVI
jgi:hypothetical protein